MKHRFSTLLLTLASASSALLAQPLPDRYRSDVATAVSTTSGVLYSANTPHVSTTGLPGGVQFANEQTYGSTRINLKMDIYQPQGDTLSRRPVIIFCFGGGFVNGTRTAAGMVALAQAFARRGFVTASIDYRLGMNLTDPEKAKRAVYRALQDSRTAVRFFRNNARLYRVDPNQVFVAGHSAGGFVALQNAYLDREAERPASTFANGSLPDLGTLDGVGDNRTDAQGRPLSGKANAALAFAGALGELSNVEGAGDVPVVMFHSRDDNTVPYNSGEPFSFLNYLPGINLPIVYGGNLVNTRADAVGAPHVFYPYTNRGHNVYFSGSDNAPVLYPDIVPRGTSFFYDYRLKPTAASIEGSASVCSNALSQTYRVAGDFGYCDWQVVGGSIVGRAPNAVTVAWSATAAARRLTVTPYSRQLAQGQPSSLAVGLTTCPALLAANVAPAADLATGAVLAYPNPATTRLTVQLPAAGRPTALRLLDKMGATRASGVSAVGAGATLDVGELPAGVYYLQVVTDHGVVTQRIQKE